MGKIKIDEIGKAEGIGREAIGAVRKVEGVICKLEIIKRHRYHEGRLPKSIERIVELEKIQGLDIKEQELDIKEAEKQGYILRISDWSIEIWEPIPQEKIIRAARENLIERKRSIATGIGVFAAVYTKDEKILLRVRTEKGSMYGEDLSGKPELPGGGTDMSDFDQSLSYRIEDNYKRKYTDVVENTLRRELKEETGLFLPQLYEPIKMYPAWLFKEPLIDLAFVVPVKADWVKETKKYKELKEKNQVRFFSSKELVDANITSPRMRFLIESAFSAIQK